MQLSMFYGARATKPTRVDSDEFWEDIRTGKWEKEITELRKLLRSKGKAVFVTSTAARRPGSGGLSYYAATKGALNSWVISEGRRQAKKGIGLCAVAPGFFESPMTDEMAPGLVEAVTKAIPFGRFGSCDEIATFIDSLLDQSNWTLAGSIYECAGGA